MKGECISEKNIHEQNSKRGFDICYVCSNDVNCEQHYLYKNIESEEKAWEEVNRMSQRNPSYFAIIYVVYYRDINGTKGPVPGYRTKVFIF